MIPTKIIIEEDRNPVDDSINTIFPSIPAPNTIITIDEGIHTKFEGMFTIIDVEYNFTKNTLTLYVEEYTSVMKRRENHE